MALYKVCTERGLRFGRCEEDFKAIIKEKNVTKPSKEQLDQALDTAEEERHAILFLYKADKYKYGKLFEEMENDILQKKDPFPKTIVDMCGVIAGWKNKDGGKYNQFAEANDGVVFTMTTSDEPKNKGKKKNITCFKRYKKGHYLNKFKEKNAKKTTKILRALKRD